MIRYVTYFRFVDDLMFSFNASDDNDRDHL